MNFPEWVPFATVTLGAVYTVINGLIFFSFRSVVDRLEKVEKENDAIWGKISDMRVDSAKEGATRADILRLQDHLQNQDRQLAAINTLVARLVPQPQ